MAQEARGWPAQASAVLDGGGRPWPTCAGARQGHAPPVAGACGLEARATRSLAAKPARGLASGASSGSPVVQGARWPVSQHGPAYGGRARTQEGAAPGGSGRSAWPRRTRACGGTAG